MRKKLFMPLLIAMVAVVTQSCSLIVAIQKATILGGESWRDPVGLHAGVSHKIVEISESVSLRGEANISMQGAKWEENGMKGKVSLLYLNAPFVVQYRTPGRIFIEAGLQPGLLLRARDVYEGSSYDYREYVRSFDLGIPVGAGYIINDQFEVGVRVIPGITNINAGEYYDTTDRNFVAALRFTYNFNFQGK